MTFGAIKRETRSTTGTSQHQAVSTGCFKRKLWKKKFRENADCVRYMKKALPTQHQRILFWQKNNIRWSLYTINCSVCKKYGIETTETWYRCIHIVTCRRVVKRQLCERSDCETVSTGRKWRHVHRHRAGCCATHGKHSSTLGCDVTQQRSAVRFPPVRPRVYRRNWNS
jgi:hypothetical protein